MTCSPSSGYLPPSSAVPAYTLGSSDSAGMLPKQGTTGIWGPVGPGAAGPASGNPTPTESENYSAVLHPGGSKDIGIIFPITLAAMP